MMKAKMCKIRRELGLRERFIITNHKLMESSKIVHIAAEVVLLGGITFYFNGQIKSLKNEIKELKTKIEEQSEANNKHLNNVYSLLDKLSHASLLANSAPLQTQQRSQAPVEGLRRRRSPESRSRDSESFEPKQSKNESSNRKPSLSVHQRSEPIPEELQEDDLDDQLAQELQELQEDEMREETEDELKGIDPESNSGFKKK